MIGGLEEVNTLILKSEILNILYDIPYIFGYKSVNPASHVLINN